MRLPRSTGAVSGLLLVVLGLWGALIPFVGPYFDYSFGVNSTWHYTSDRLWLDILPGALTVIGGLLLIGARTRSAGIFAGWLALIGGAWLVVGPAVSLTWESGQGPIGRPLFGSTRQMLELVGYFYGLGALVVALSAFSIGRFMSRPRVATEAAAVASGPSRRRRAASRAAAAGPAADERAAERLAAGERATGEPAPATGTAPAEPARAQGPPEKRRLFARRRRGAYRTREDSTVER
jgi:hypothetical protein